MNPAPSMDARTAAFAKALVLRDMMRAAARDQISPLGQCLLAILIAESWRNERSGLWVARLSQARLCTRTGRGESSVKYALRELRESSLVIIQPGRNHSTSRYTLNHDASVRSSSTVSPLTLHPSAS